MKAIIPCAGFGTRMGMRPDQAKELLLDDLGQPMINWTLTLCLSYGLDPLIILRKEKRDLIEFCEERDLEYLIVEPEGEWPTTVVKSRERWVDHNILLLPDTRFTNIRAVFAIKEHMALGASMVIGTHTVPDPQKWGIVHRYHIHEKPISSMSNTAWGVIAFQDTVFSETFFIGLEFAKVSRLNDASFVDLGEFKDITRK